MNWWSNPHLLKNPISLILKISTYSSHSSPIYCIHRADRVIIDTTLVIFHPAK